MENISGNIQFEPLVTLCEMLFLLSAGEAFGRIATVAIPEVLIGEVNLRVEHLNYTNLRRCAGFFLPLSQCVTSWMIRNTSLHLGSFACFLLLAG
ncbi:hypothetical protein POH93_25560 [Phytobacter diazotrophicus]|uniref:hypothetical protein n=1 Tax=Phytobacter diazotrophicus TaxID=395631 RepID=UPI00232D8E78|nr:hypothetical protein [Phytobacter diazotrophicus]MDC0728732.1 hypothetical protein [Phytobacter diazotrophicus]MDC0735966.1 hypothetical protein [Phytobacter diazotrophicus]